MWGLFLLLLFQAAPTMDAQPDAERLFNLGTQLYADGDAAGAVAAFEGVEATGWTSGMLHYNLGTAHLSLQQNGPAILHFERALRLMPGNDAVAHNLRIARERAGIADEPASPFEWLGTRMSRRAGPLFWLGLGFVFYLCTIGLTAFRFWNRRSGSWSRRALTVLVPITLCVLVAAFSVWRDARIPAAIVLSDDVQLRASPSPEASSRATLQPGQQVRITETREEWQAVRLPGGIRGWLPSRAVERI